MLSILQKLAIFPPPGMQLFLAMTNENKATSPIKSAFFLEFAFWASCNEPSIFFLAAALLPAAAEGPFEFAKTILTYQRSRESYQTLLNPTLSNNKLKPPTVLASAGMDWN